MLEIVKTLVLTLSVEQAIPSRSVIDVAREESIRLCAMLPELNDEQRAQCVSRMVTQFYHEVGINQSNRADVINVVKEIFTANFFGSRSKLNPLPLTLADLDQTALSRVYYFKSERQTNGYTCGYWTVANAWALLAALRNNTINSTFISDCAREFFRGLGNEILNGIQFCQRYLSERCGTRIVKGVEVPNFAPNSTEFLDAEHIFHISNMPRVELPHFHILSFSGGPDHGIFFEVTEPNLPAQFKGLSPEELLQQYVPFIQGDINNNPTSLHFFVCNLQRDSVHWVLCAVLKFNNRPPAILIFDSYNLDIHADSEVGLFISWLCNRFL